MDGQGVAIDWEASSTSSWLTVTPSGVAGEEITITANPAGLSENSLSEAVVTVISPLSDVSNIAEIHVELWNSDEATSEKTINIETNSIGPKVSIATDPIRPYVYTVTSEPPDISIPARTVLYAHNAYTGEENVTPISSQIFNSPTVLISDDGRFMYIVPGSFNGSAGQFERYDLPVLGPPTRFNLPAGSIGGDVDFTRVNGVPYLITGAGGVIDADNGAVLSSLPSLNGGSISASQNGIACLRNLRGNNTAILDCFDLLGTGLANTDIAARARNRNMNFLDPAAIAISSNGMIVYTSLNGQLRALATDESGAEIFTTEAASLIEISANGTILADGFTDDQTMTTIRALNQNGTLSGSAPLGIGFPLDFAVTSDGERLALLETDMATGEDIMLRLINTP